MYDTTAAAEAIVSRVAHLLEPAEITRMRSSLEIDLHMGEAHAINRAVRSLESHRLGYRSSMSRVEADAIAEISKLARLIPQPVRANAHLSPAASAASVITSWFGTAHVDTAPLVFRTRVESPVL